MSRFFTDRFRDLEPYVPGEQPRDRKYLKLNTNESPFPPAPLAQQRAAEAAKGLQLYSDPEGTALRAKLAERFCLNAEEFILCNGSDEILNFAFAAFCDEKYPALFPDITYGFYPVFARVNRVPYTEIPLREDFSLNVDDYTGRKGTVFLANPNAPTGLVLRPEEIRRLLESDRDRVVVADEAYIDFGNESALPLIRSYDNLLVVRTYSKSRSMAGARLGFAAGNPALIRDLNTLRYSTNPYNVDSMTLAAGLGALEDDDYNAANCAVIVENRDYLYRELLGMGFSGPASSANFVFVKHPRIAGKDLYLALRQRGILVRHFDKERIRDYNRITIGTKEQMDALLLALKEILEEI